MISYIKLELQWSSLPEFFKNMAREFCSPQGVMQPIGRLPLPLIGQELFFENPLIINRMERLNPLPRRCPILIVMRVSKDGSAKGCLLNKHTSQKLTGSGESISDLFENLCARSNYDPESIKGVVVFMSLEVTLESMGENLKTVINQLAPKTLLWFPEAEAKKIPREERRKRKNYLSSVLKLASSKSVNSRGGFCYSAGRLGAKRRAEPVLPAQTQFELSI